METQLPRITVFSLGGTIASTKNSAGSLGGVTPQLGADELVAAVPELGHMASIEAVSFREVASPNLGFADLTDLAREITLRFDDGVLGVVVTQGTDTLEETAFLLDLLVRSSKPVVVTGAMRNPTLAGSDGSANILAAVQTALSPQARGLGCVVVMNDEIHAARFVRKMHTASPSTFHSPNAGPLGSVIEGRPRIVLRPPALARVVVDSARIPSVALLRCSLDDDLRLVTHVESMGYAGLVIEAFGGGHVSERAVPALEKLAARIPVVLASRTGSGDVLEQTYGYVGSEKDLLSRGLISAGLLDGLKARLLLCCVASDDRTLEEVSGAFRTFNDSLAGQTYVDEARNE